MENPATHNLLVVSDVHMGEGLIAEAGERCHKYDAFLYDASFSRFLQYHEQNRRDAQDELHNLPWRLILNGDIIDFWDMADPPGDLQQLVVELDRLINNPGNSDEALDWLKDWRDVFVDEKVNAELPPLRPLSDIQTNLASGKLQNRSYQTIREILDKLVITDGACRRRIESLAWWIEVLINKHNFELSKSELKHGLGTTWREVVWKLTQVYRGHREFYTAIAWFIACGNEVILLKGNHDLELYWPQVHNGQFPYILVDAYKDLLLGSQAGPRLKTFSEEQLTEEEFKELLPDYTSDDLALASTPGNKYIYKEWFHLEEDLVYIEHGNQYEPLDSSVYFLSPKLPSDPEKIELPWGGLMARYIYNKIVAVHPFAVNVKPEEKIIHWMISNDFFRFLGIIVTAFPDVIRGLGRGIKQGLRGRWIWGDRSLLGLIPRFAYDFIQLVLPTVCEVDQETENDELSKIDAIVSSYAPASENHNTGGTEVTQSISEPGGSDNFPPRAKACIGCLLHLGIIGMVILSIITGIAWLSGQDSPSYIIPWLICFGFITLFATVWGGIKIKDHNPVSILGELLIQLGGVGIIVGLAFCIFLSSHLGWENLQQTLALVIPISLMAIGYIMVKFWPPKNEHRKVYIDWFAEAIHSSSSLLKELSLVSFIASVFIILETQAAWDAMPWLLTSLFLFVAGWGVNRIHTIYGSRFHMDRFKKQWIEEGTRVIRIVVTIVIAGLVLALLVNILAAFTIILLGSLPQYEKIVEAAQNITDFFTSSVSEHFYLPLQVILMAVIGLLILCETHYCTFFRWLKKLFAPLFSWLKRLITPLCRLLNRLNIRCPQTENQANQKEIERQVVKEQLLAIKKLAMSEQRRFATCIWKVLNFLLPLLSVIVLVAAIIGFGAAIGAVFNIGDNIDLVGGLSIGSISGFAFWILRQLSASFQKHDPSSGFGDLYYRMATQLSYIFSNPLSSQGGMGYPRYFIFGHDHWADCEMIEGPSQLQTGKSSERKTCWYVNSGTWLRGYVEEQRRQEVNENHSTFVQIIPGHEMDQTPRVLRWNDALNQPERIIRRSKPSSAGQKLANQWRQASLRWIIWGIVLIVISPILGWIMPDRMGNLYPILWAIVLWLIINLVKPTIDWLSDWDDYCQKKKQTRNIKKPSPE